MNKIQKEALRMSRVFLVENVQANVLWDYLVHYEIFTPIMLEYITCKKPRSEQVRTLLQDLERRHYEAYEGFIKCLNDTEQGHCALEIRRNQRIAEGKQGITAVAESSAHEMSYQEHLMRSFDIPYSVSAMGRGDATLHPTTPSENVASYAGMPETISVSIQEDEDVEMTSVPEESSSVQASEPGMSSYSRARQETPEGVYKMESSPRGIMYIINNQHFRDGSRDGSDKDEHMLRQLFDGIGYQVLVHRDLTAQEMKEKLLQLRSREDLNRMDSLVVAILSHGAMQKILGVDGGSITEDDLMEWFGNHNCPLLMGKPKLFIIQACRGGRIDPGVPTCYSDLSSSTSSASWTGSSHFSPSSSQSSCASDVICVSRELDHTGSDAPAQRQSLPRNTDILIAHSSVAGYVAYRWRDEGSIFITEVVKVFREHAQTKHVNDMFTQVNRHVASFNTPQDSHCQMPSPVNQLLKDWYLNPPNL